MSTCYLDFKNQTIYLFIYPPLLRSTHTTYRTKC